MTSSNLHFYERQTNSFCMIFIEFFPDYIYAWLSWTPVHVHSHNDLHLYNVLYYTSKFRVHYAKEYIFWVAVERLPVHHASFSSRKHEFAILFQSRRGWHLLLICQLCVNTLIEGAQNPISTENYWVNCSPQSRVNWKRPLGDAPCIRNTPDVIRHLLQSVAFVEQSVV